MEEADGLIYHLGHIAAAELEDLLLALHLRIGQHLVNQAGEPVALTLDELETLLLFFLSAHPSLPQGLGEHLDRGQGCFQLVADKAYEVRFEPGRPGLPKDVAQRIKDSHHDHQDKKNNRPGEGRKGQDLEAPKTHRKPPGFREITKLQVGKRRRQRLRDQEFFRTGLLLRIEQTP